MNLTSEDTAEILEFCFRAKQQMLSRAQRRNGVVKPAKKDCVFCEGEWFFTLTKSRGGYHLHGRCNGTCGGQVME